MKSEQKSGDGSGAVSCQGGKLTLINHRSQRRNWPSITFHKAPLLVGCLTQPLTCARFVDKCTKVAVIGKVTRKASVAIISTSYWPPYAIIDAALLRSSNGTCQVTAHTKCLPKVAVVVGLSLCALCQTVLFHSFSTDVLIKWA